MAGLAVVVCTVLAVKPYSGCYPACYNCRRKLRQCRGSEDTASYWCCECREQQEEKDVAWRYYLGLSVSDHSALTDVVAFGEQLDVIFGAPASQFHLYLARKNQNTASNYPNALCHSVYEELNCMLVGRCLALGFKVPRPHCVDRAVEGCSLLQLRKAMGRNGAQTGSLVVTTLKLLGHSWTSVLGLMLEDHLAGAQEGHGHSSSAAAAAAVATSKQLPVCPEDRHSQLSVDETSTLDDSLTNSACYSLVQLNTFSNSSSKRGAENTLHGFQFRHDGRERVPDQVESSLAPVSSDSLHTCATCSKLPSSAATSDFTVTSGDLRSSQIPVAPWRYTGLQSTALNTSWSEHDLRQQIGKDRLPEAEACCPLDPVEHPDAREMEVLVSEWNSFQTSPGTEWVASHIGLVVCSGEKSPTNSVPHEQFSSLCLGANFLTEFEGAFDQSRSWSERLVPPRETCEEDAPGTHMITPSPTPHDVGTRDNTAEVFSGSKHSSSRSYYSPELFSSSDCHSHTQDMDRLQSSVSHWLSIARSSCSSSTVDFTTPALPRSFPRIRRRNLMCPREPGFASDLETEAELQHQGETVSMLSPCQHHRASHTTLQQTGFSPDLFS